MGAAVVAGAAARLGAGARAEACGAGVAVGAGAAAVVEAAAGAVARADTGGAAAWTAATPPAMRVNYVGFSTSTTITHAHHVLSKAGGICSTSTPPTLNLLLLLRATA
jgi:hypothetical protein